MIILGIDTSCEQASCALYINGAVSEIKSEADKRKHSETLMPMVEKFLIESNVDISDVDLFAVSSGPGSFTGLRIGIAAVKGLAYSLGKKIACVKSLDILSNHFQASDNIICPVIDARNDQVYTALYKWNGSNYAVVTNYMGLKIEELAGLLKKYNQTVEFCGDASMQHYGYFKNAGVRCAKPNNSTVYPSAAVLVNMVGNNLGNFDVVDPEEAVPFYLRVSQAERLYGKN